MSEKALEAKVKEVVKGIRPRLQADGGDLEVAGVKGGLVKVKLTGACHGCPMAQVTLKHFVEEYLKERIPEISGVEAV